MHCIQIYLYITVVGEVPRSEKLSLVIDQPDEWRLLAGGMYDDWFDRESAERRDGRGDVPAKEIRMVGELG